MKKKILVTTLLVSTMLAMAACGGTTTNETKDPVTSQSSTVETPEDSSSVETPSTEDSSSVETPSTEVKSYADMLGEQDFTYEVVDGKIVMVLNSHSWEWTISNYEEFFTCVTGTENDGWVTYYELTPSKAGMVEVNAYAVGGETMIDNYLICTIADDLTFTVEESFNTESLGGIGGLLPEEMDAETDVVMQTILNGLGDTIYRDSLITRMVNMDDEYDPTWVLGERVSELTGIQCAELTEPMMGSIALSIAVVEFDTAENAKAGATILEESAPTGKWVCVMPDGVRAKVVGNCVIVLMANNDILTAFDGIEF